MDGKAGPSIEAIINFTFFHANCDLSFAPIRGRGSGPGLAGGSGLFLLYGLRVVCSGPEFSDGWLHGNVTSVTCNQSVALLSSPYILQIA